jgi:hypothetical protein
MPQNSLHKQHSCKAFDPAKRIKHAQPWLSVKLKYLMYDGSPYSANKATNLFAVIIQ